MLSSNDFFTPRIFLLVVMFLLSVSKGSSLATPSSRQLDFMDMEFSMFMHFNLATWAQIEHNCMNSPCISADFFNPAFIDTDEWAQVAASMGAKEICLTAHHEGGFCLWPTHYSNYSVKYSPWKEGKGDLIQDFVDSCRKYDILPCFYLSASADGYHIDETPEEFIKNELGMLTEVLTQYGPINRLWFDHYWEECGGYALCPGGFPDLWKKVADHVTKVSPNTIQGPGKDLWLNGGGESGSGMYPLWNAASTDLNNNPVAGLNSSGPYQPLWRSRESDMTIQNPGDAWFWKTDNNKGNYLSSLELFMHYLVTVGRGANLVLNIPPDESGRIPLPYKEEAKGLGDYLSIFQKPIGKVERKTQNCMSDQFTVLDFGSPKAFDIVSVMEGIETGQKIQNYQIEYYSNSAWHSIYPLHGGTVGHKVIDILMTPITATQLRFRCISLVGEGDVSIRSFAAFNSGLNSTDLAYLVNTVYGLE